MKRTQALRPLCCLCEMLLNGNIIYCQYIWSISKSATKYVPKGNQPINVASYDIHQPNCMVTSHGNPKMHCDEHWERLEMMKNLHYWTQLVWAQ